MKNNVGKIHSGCANQRHEQWQKNNPNTVIRKGDLVKLGFPFKHPSVGKSKEYMWIKIVKVNKKIITGSLANDPIFVNATEGTIVDFTYDEIVDHEPKD